jgi:hypothetical protein
LYLCGVSGLDYNTSKNMITNSIHICCLFNDAVCNIDYIALSDWMTENNKLGTMQQGEVVVLFTVLSGDFLQGLRRS